MRQISFQLPEFWLEGLDTLNRAGLIQNRTEGIRTGLRWFLEAHGILPTPATPRDPQFPAYVRLTQEESEAILHLLEKGGYEATDPKLAHAAKVIRKQCDQLFWNPEDYRASTPWRLA